MAALRPRRALLFALFLLLALPAGCTARAQSPVVSASVVEAMRAPDAEGYARAVEPFAFEFPRDHGPHPEYRTEWWYYTGALQDADGRDYGYQLTFFRSALTPQPVERASTLAGNQVYMAHFAVSDGPARAHWSVDRYSRGAAGLAGAQGTPDFAVWLEDWSARAVEPGVVRLLAMAETEEGPFALDLTLTETRPPVLHGERGLHQKGPEPGNASYYYSLVGLQTTGTIATPTGTVNVQGQSWMDHEFGTSALSGDAQGWDWFSLQLGNGAALMLYTIRSTSGEVQQVVQGTLAWPDGSQTPIRAADFSLTPTAFWTSPATGIRYPVGWEVAVPGEAIALTVTPLFAEQEMEVEFRYWEGAVTVTGTVDGAPVTGRGYVELTGYGPEGTGQYQR